MAMLGIRRPVDMKKAGECGSSPADALLPAPLLCFGVPLGNARTELFTRRASGTYLPGYTIAGQARHVLPTVVMVGAPAGRAGNA